MRLRTLSGRMRPQAAQGTHMRPAVPNTCPSLSRRGGNHLRVLAGPGGFLDPALGFGLLAGDALGTDPQEYVHAVARPLGDLGRWHSGVEPGGHRRVAKVIGPSGQQRCGLALGNCDVTCLVEDLEVGPVVEDAATWAGEDAAGGPGGVLLQVLGEECDQLRMERARDGFLLAAGA